MNLPALGFAVAGSVVAYFLITLGTRWWHSRGLRRALERVRRARESGSPVRLYPESRFVVRLTETEVACERPDGNVERVAWQDLQKVEVVTTSDGPQAPDVFWVLHGTTGGCAIPQGATGDAELLSRLQDLPGFDNGAVIQAMCCASDARFLCWRRPG